MTSGSHSCGRCGRCEQFRELVHRFVRGHGCRLEAAIAQSVQIELDFILTLEAHGRKPAETIDDDQTITVTEHSEFIANDGDDDS